MIELVVAGREQLPLETVSPNGCLNTMKRAVDATRSETTELLLKGTIIF